MVIVITIGIYDDNDSFCDLQFIQSDLKNMRELFGRSLNYVIFPKKPRTYWKQKDLMTFLVRMARDFNNNRNIYDALVVAISCHGMQNTIVCSDSRGIERAAIHRIFSHHYPKVREKVRLFIFDCCDGGWSRNTSARMLQHSGDVTKLSPAKSVIVGTNAHDQAIAKQASFKDLDTNNMYVENESMREYISGRVIGLDYIDGLNKTFTAVWNRNELNPDHRLITVRASNIGFEAKMSQHGSYLIKRFTELLYKNIFQQDNELFLNEILDKVQDELRLKQLTTHTCNNETGFVKFYKYDPNRVSKNMNLDIAIHSTTSTRKLRKPMFDATETETKDPDGEMSDAFPSAGSEPAPAPINLDIIHEGQNSNIAAAASAITPFPPGITPITAEKGTRNRGLTDDFVVVDDAALDTPTSQASQARLSFVQMSIDPNLEDDEEDGNDVMEGILKDEISEMNDVASDKQNAQNSKSITDGMEIVYEPQKSNSTQIVYADDEDKKVKEKPQNENIKEKKDRKKIRNKKKNVTADKNKKKKKKETKVEDKDKRGNEEKKTKKKKGKTSKKKKIKVENEESITAEKSKDNDGNETSDGTIVVGSDNNDDDNKLDLLQDTNDVSMDEKKENIKEKKDRKKTQNKNKQKKKNETKGKNKDKKGNGDKKTKKKKGKTLEKKKVKAENEENSADNEILEAILLDSDNNDDDKKSDLLQETNDVSMDEKNKNIKEKKDRKNKQKKQNETKVENKDKKGNGNKKSKKKKKTLKENMDEERSTEMGIISGNDDKKTRNKDKPKLNDNKKNDKSKPKKKKKSGDKTK